MNIYIVCLLVFSVYAGGCGAFSGNLLTTVNNNFLSTRPLVSTNNSPNPNTKVASPRFGFGSLISGSLSGAANLANGVTGTLTSGIRNVAGATVDATLSTVGNLANGATTIAASTANLSGTIANGVKGVTTAAVGASLTTAGGLLGGVRNITSSTVNLTESIASGVKGVATAVGTSLASGDLVHGVQNVASSTLNLTGSIANGVKGVASAAVGTSLGTAVNLVSGVHNVTSSAINMTGDVLNGVKDTAVVAVNTTLQTAGNLAGTAIDLALRVSETAINAGVNLVLSAYKKVVQTLNVDEMPLPPLSLPSFIFMSFNARNGFFKKLSSLSIDGEISIKRTGTRISLKVPLRFDDMEIGYKNYSFSVVGFGTEGSVKIGVKSNKVRLGLSIALSTSCALSFDEFSLADLDDIQIDFTGLCYYCGVITSKVSSIMVNFLHGPIKNMIQEKMSSIMKTVISENSVLCAKFISSKA